MRNATPPDDMQVELRVRVPYSLRVWFMERATRDGVSLASLVTRAMREWKTRNPMREKE